MSISSYEHGDALSKIVKIFEQIDLPYFLVGSFASGFRGEFRATNDIDIVCRFTKDEQIKRFLELTRSEFYRDPLSIADAIEKKSSCNLIHEKTLVKIDIFNNLSELELNEFDRATLLKIPGSQYSAYIATAEYNIIAKLNWYIKSNKVLERQLADVRSMLAINESKLDHDYIKTWTDVYGTSSLLEKLINEME